MSIATQTADVTTSKILWGTQLENADKDAETKLFNTISRKIVKIIFYQKFWHLRLEQFCFQIQMQKCKLLAHENNHTTNMKKLDETTTQMTTHGLRCLAGPSQQRQSRDFVSFSKQEHLRFKVICKACDEEDSIEDAFNEYIIICLEEAESTWYHAPRGPYHKLTQGCWFKEHLDDDETGDQLPWLAWSASWSRKHGFGALK